MMIDLSKVEIKMLINFANVILCTNFTRLSLLFLNNALS